MIMFGDTDIVPRLIVLLRTILLLDDILKIVRKKNSPEKRNSIGHLYQKENIPSEKGSMKIRNLKNGIDSITNNYINQK